MKKNINVALVTAECAPRTRELKTPFRSESRNEKKRAQMKQSNCKESRYSKSEREKKRERGREGGREGERELAEADIPYSLCAIII